MKSAFTTLCLLLATLTAGAQAQRQQPYDTAPDEYEQVFLDHVEGYASHIITLGRDQYLGQTDNMGNLYGYGRFLRSDGTQLFGKFRNGKLLLGITLGKEAALVGSTTSYCSYSLTTGQIDFTMPQDGYSPSASGQAQPMFLTLQYANGDRYVGETLNGKRHGLGLYYYANGDIWFGHYSGNFRQGFGALFTHDNEMVIGLWEGEDARRQITVPQTK